MKTKADYDALIKELEAVEKSTGLYLSDEGVDRENVYETEADSMFWTRMYEAATMAAGQRAEEIGHDINKLLGRVIY